ncbi:unnamed protein product [Polarella glacialis]|uniref:PRELI/MSF1 domain-containing protein n=1 Tax=Polarella glacialis TaxID=89957 RepID=A0A813J6G2_POLGL|nr:unnamed protein product [Polarella glacialis]
MTERREMTEAVPLYSNEQILDYDWAVVTAAFLQKFPDPDLKYVKSVETVNRVVCEEKQTMDLRRLFYCTFKIPRLAEKLLGKRTTVVCVEEAHWDLGRRHLSVHGRNETGSSKVRIDEVCCYTEVAPGQTLYTQSATVVYRKGLISGLLTPVASQILGGICQKNAGKGLTTMVVRTEREKVIQQGGSAASADAAATAKAAQSLSEGPGSPGPTSLAFLAAGIVGIGLAWSLCAPFARELRCSPSDRRDH